MLIRVGFANLQTTPFKRLPLRYTECSLCSAAACGEHMGFTCMLFVECTSAAHWPPRGNPCRMGYQPSLPISRQNCGACGTSCLSTAARSVLTLYRVGCTSFRVFPWSHQLQLGHVHGQLGKLQLPTQRCHCLEMTHPQSAHKSTC